MFCRNCGRELPENARFCNGCGTPVSVPEAEETAGAEPAAPENEQISVPQDGLTAALAQTTPPESVETTPVRPTEVMPVSGVLHGEQSTQILGKKRGKGLLLIAAVVAVIVLAVVVIVLLPSGGGSGISSIAYLTDDGELMYRKDLKAKTSPAEVADDEPGGVQFSQDGKYLYYKRNSSLYRAEVAKLSKADPEKIASDVSSYNVMKNGNVVYAKEDQLRFYDGKDSYKLTSDFSGYYLNEAETYVYYSDFSDDGAVLYRVPLKEDSEKEKLVKGYDIIADRGDGMIIYGKYDDEYDYDIYSQVPGGDKSKLASHVDQILAASSDKGKVSMTYLTSDTIERDGRDMVCYNLCTYENGKETVMAKKIDRLVGYSVEDGIYLYTRINDSYDEEYYQYVGGKDSRFRLDEDSYVRGMYVLSSSEVVLRVSLDGDSVLQVYTAGTDGLTAGTVLEDGDGFGAVEIGPYKGKNALYYYTDISKRGNEGELMRYVNGEKTSIAKDAAHVILLEDSSAAFKMEKDGEDYSLYQIKDSRSEHIADEVSDLAILSSKQIAYVSDGDLYVRNGGKSEKLASDVESIFAVKEAEQQKYFCYGY